MARVETIWGANMKDTARLQNTIEVLHNRLVVADVLENLKTNYLIKGSRFAAEIIKIFLLKPKPLWICLSIVDQKLFRLANLLGVGV